METYCSGIRDRESVCLRASYSIGFLNYSLSHEKLEMWDTNRLISK